MPKRSSTQPKDPDVAVAPMPASIASGQAPKPFPDKNPAAQALGRLGGLKGGKARAAQMTSEERKESARKAAVARWAKKTS